MPENLNNTPQSPENKAGKPPQAVGESLPSVEPLFAAGSEVAETVSEVADAAKSRSTLPKEQPAAVPASEIPNKEIEMLKQKLEEESNYRKELEKKIDSITTDSEKNKIETEINKLKKDGVIATDDTEAVKR
jgi:hypothetical protein